MCNIYGKGHADWFSLQLTFDNGIIAAPVKEYAGRRRRTTVDLVPLIDGNRKWIWSVCGHLG